MPQQEARVIVREAQGRADLVLQHTQSRFDDFEREMSELRLRRGDVETSLEASDVRRSATPWTSSARKIRPCEARTSAYTAPRQADADAPGTQRPVSLPVALSERHAKR